MAQYGASYEVNASNYDEGELDLEGLTPDEMAEVIETSHPGVTVCHQCARDVEDPEIGDLVSFTVDGIDYKKNDKGMWVIR